MAEHFAGKNIQIEKKEEDSGWKTTFNKSWFLNGSNQSIKAVSIVRVQRVHNENVV